MRKKSNTPSKKLAMSQTGAAVDLRDAIIRALEDERFDWRTVGGLARTLGVSEAEVVSVLNSMPDVVVRATTAEGQNVFTTRSHYEKTHGFGDRLLSALADRVVA